MGYFSKDMVEDKLREYNLTKSLKIRNEIVLICTPLVDSVAKKYDGMDKTLKIDELKSYGYEGLISAIETFNNNRGNFINYFCECIRNRIRNGIEELKGYPQTYYWDFLSSRRPIEKENGEYLEYDLTRLEYLIEKIEESGSLSSERCQKLRIIFNINNGIPLNNADNFPEKKDNISEIMLREDIRKALESLSERDRKIIMLRYGFINNRTYSLNEIAEYYSITHEGIRYIEKKAHKKLKKVLGEDYLK